MGGDAVADVPFGEGNPGGRLPVTFYRSVEDLAAFDDCRMGGIPIDTCGENRCSHSATV